MNKTTLTAIFCVIFSHSSLAMLDSNMDNNITRRINNTNNSKKMEKKSFEDKKSIEESERNFESGVREYKKKNDESYKAALDYFSTAASSGHDGAQNCLGILYEYGFGTPRSLPLAKKWYCESAKNGNTRAKQSVERLSSIEDYYQYKLFGIW